MIGFFLCFLIIFCIAYCLERRDSRRRAKRWKTTSTGGQNDSSHSSHGGEPLRRSIQKTFGDGVFEVGIDIAPGTYRSIGGNSSFPTIWHRLSDFTGNGIIAEGGCAGPSIVTIAKSDHGFESLNSGGWTLIDEHRVEPTI